MSLEGHIHNGVIVFDQPVSLPEGAKVRVEVLPEAASTIPKKSLLDRLQPFVGVLQHLPEDAAVNHDHYLYSSPKKS